MLYIWQCGSWPATVASNCCNVCTFRMSMNRVVMTLWLCGLNEDIFSYAVKIFLANMQLLYIVVTSLQFSGICTTEQVPRISIEDINGQNIF